MSSFPGMRKLRITANDTKSLATKYSQAHFIYGNTEWFTAYSVRALRKTMEEQEPTSELFAIKRM